MKASIVDLRYKMNSVLQALERNEPVEVYYRGRLKAIMEPIQLPRKKKFSVIDSPFFGSRKDDARSVRDLMNELRTPRAHDV